VLVSPSNPASISGLGTSIFDGVVARENVIRLDFTSPIADEGSAITDTSTKRTGRNTYYLCPVRPSTAFPVFDQPDLKAGFAFVKAKIPECGLNMGSDPFDVVDKVRFSRPIIGSFETKPISTTSSHSRGPAWDYSKTF
jgi:hypothetical protein